MNLIMKKTISCFFCTVINFWYSNSGNGYIGGGVTYRDGKLKVPTSGLYYVYAQVYFVQSNAQGRFHVKKNKGHVFLLGHATAGVVNHGTVYSGGLFHLCQDDEVYIDLWFTHYIWQGGQHTYFGLYKVD